MTTPTTAKDASSMQSKSSSKSSSRVCIKNLPLSYTTATKLKSHLQSSQPTLQITDCKILKTKDGKTRKIAFVGYSSSHAAQTAVQYFDKSFIGTSRLSVSLAFSKKEKNKKNNDNGDNGNEVYRPWSKHSVGSSRYEKLHQQQQDENDNAVEKEKGKSKNESSNAEDASESDRKRDEFLSAMGISTSSKQKKGEDTVSKSKFWANDDAIVEQPTVDGVRGVDDHANDDTTHHDGTKKEGKSDSSSSDGSSESDSENDTTDNNAADNDTKKKVSSDLDFLKSKQVKADILSDESDNDGNAHDDSSSVSSSDSDDSSSSDDGSSSSEDEDEADKSKSKEMQNIPESSSDKAQEKADCTTNVPPNNNILLDRLFVRNLPFTTTEEDLIETFSQFGSVASVHIPVDDTKRNKGYAFINFESKKDAKLAMDTMDGQDFQGRLIHILPARPSADQTDIDPNLSYKERQELARQKEAEKTSKGWSASFLRGDAVVDNVANRLGVSKGDVLNVKDGISSGNAAVRLALGETHIITENIAFFEEHGVDVTALESKSNDRKGGSGSISAPTRSKTMILVKNLPYDTTLEELTKVFHEIGGEVPQKMLLPPSKTAALVEYGHATDARRAFRRLAYKKFKHVPLYLEWAPMRADGKKKQQDSGAAKDDTTAEEIEKKDTSVVKPGLVDEDPSTETADTGVSQTIYVKNLNFSTTEDQLEKAFTQAGCQPRAVKIPTKSAPVKKHNKSKAAASSTSNEMKQLSMGFGFVEFPSEEEALSAIKAMNGKVVDGHALEIKLSTKSLSSSSSTKMPPIDKSSKNTKIMVRNVPFEATRTELLQLFGSFGQLKKVRLPKKFDGTHRGFAFCEFVTSKEAQNAMTTLSRTHLYGRHLVLEWATEGEDDGNAAADVGVAREKAKRDAMRAGFGGSAGGSVKRGKHLKF